MLEVSVLSEEQNVTLRKYAAIVKQQEEAIDMYVGVLSKHSLLPECVPRGKTFRSSGLLDGWSSSWSVTHLYCVREKGLSKVTS